VSFIKKLFISFGVVFIVAVTAVFVYFFIPLPFLSNPIAPTKITPVISSPWGVDFSQSQAEYLKLDWKETYSAIINDLGARNIKLHTNWDWVEGKQDNFYFNDIDWQIKQAEKKKVNIIYVIGVKTGRWPECHIPTWATGLSEKDQQSELLKYITVVVNRYKKSKAIINWQVENEPLFKFGVCPGWYYQNDNFLKTEVALVKSLDPTRKIIISDSGEQSDWFDAAKIGDIVGTTMYRSVWTQVTKTFGIPLTYTFLDPTTYMRKAQIIQTMFSKPVICIELQAEPGAGEPLMQAPLSEQLKSMNPQMFEEGVAFAKQTGLSKFYFWGVEWWYWMKTVQNQPGIWNEAKQLFQTKNT
jgi:hypothetical protein